MGNDADPSERGKIDAATASGQPTRSPDQFTPIFLVSAPRSGSSWLRDMIGEHDAVATGPETYAIEALGWLLAVLDERSTRDQGLLSAGYIDRPGLGRACAELYRTAVRSRVGGRAYFVEKTPINTDFIAAIDLAFPDSKILHLVRDGRDVACSMLAARREREMRLPGDVRGGALRWKRIEGVIGFGRRHPERYYEVRYEALLADLRSEMERIFAFLAIPLDAAVLERICAVGERVRHPSAATAAQGFVGKWRTCFSADDRLSFKKAAGGLLIDLAYERDDGW
jgi:hypothetical protein